MMSTREIFWNGISVLTIITSLLVALNWHKRDPVKVNVSTVNISAYQACIDEATVPIEYQACDVFREHFAIDQ